MVFTIAFHIPKTAEEFYCEVLEILKQNKIPFLIGGTYAVMKYTGMVRETKDLDLFCKAGDYPRIIKLFSNLGFKTEVNDERWLAKIRYKTYYVDIIFNSRIGMIPVDDTWFIHSETAKLFGIKVKLMPIEELIFSKALRMGRYRFEGTDINHIILIKGKEINWKHLLTRMEAYWEILLAHILMFRFVYPSERHNIPKWLLQKLIERLKEQLSIKPPRGRISRGAMLSMKDYGVDFEQLGFLDITQS